MLLNSNTCTLIISLPVILEFITVFILTVFARSPVVPGITFAFSWKPKNVEYYTLAGFSLEEKRN